MEATYPFRGHRAGYAAILLTVATLPFALTLLALALLWQSHAGLLEVALLVGFWWFTGISISLAYHRMTAHGAFRAAAPVRALLMAGAGMALQAGPATWAATHRRHHARADRPGDPHSPLEGLWHAHFGWLPRGNLVMDGPAHASLMRDPLIRFFERTQLLWMVLGFILPGLIALAVTGTWAGFWSGVLWGGVVRVFLAHHGTWAVNSIGHAWGTRPHASPDEARNNGLLALISFGEGWHNNHHAYPSSAWIGHRWWQFDPGRTAIRLLRSLRLAWGVQVAEPVRARREARAARRSARRALPNAAVAYAVVGEPKSR